VVFVFIYYVMLFVSVFMLMRDLEASLFFEMIMKWRSIFIVLYVFLMCLAKLLQCVNSIVR